MNEPSTINQTELTSEIVAAFVSNNHLQAAELPELIRSVRQTLGTLGQAPAAPATTVAPAKPVVPIKKSITDDYLISLLGSGSKSVSGGPRLSSESE